MRLQSCAFLGGGGAAVVLAALLSCERAPPPLPPTVAPADEVPAELAFPGPALRIARSSAGMTVAFHAPVDSTQAAVALLLPRGSLHEERPGSAVMLAAMLRRAGITQDAAVGPIDGDLLGAALDTMGVELGVDAEAAHLIFRASGPAMHTARMVGIVCGLAFHPALEPDLLDAAFEELAELADERTRGTGYLADEVLRAQLFPGHPLGRPSVPGVEALAMVQLADVGRFQLLSMRPRESLLLVAGVRPEDALLAAESCRVDFPVPPAAPLTPPPERAFESPVRVQVTLDGGETAHIRVGGRAPPAGTPEAAALGVVMESLANGFSSTLVRELRNHRGLVYGVEGAVVGTRLGGTWYVGTSTAASNALTVVRVIEETLDTLHRDGLPESTWKRLARASALAFPYGREALTELLSVEMDAWILGRPPNDVWRTPAWLWNLDARWAWTSVRRYLDPATRVTVVVSREDALAPLGAHLSLKASEWP